MTGAVYIAGIGAVCAIGHDIAAIHAAVRGRLNAFRRDDRFPSIRTGQPLTLARVQSAVQGLANRMAEIGLPAASACLAAAGLSHADAPLPLFLSLPAPHPGWEQADAIRFAARFAQALPCKVDPQRSGILVSGHHGGLALMQTAHAMIADGQAQACLVGGLDAIDMPGLDWHDQQALLRAEDQPNGFIPGEGAAFVVLASADHLQARGLPARICLQAVAQAVEPQPWYGTEPSQGQGLTDVFQALLGPDGRRADITYSDQNGQSWRADEGVLAYLRTPGKHGEPLDHRHPADCWGDVGAASGPMLVAFAACDLRPSWTSSARSALVACSSGMAPYRAGALLHRISDERTSPP